MKIDQLDDMELWLVNHTWYDDFEMGAIDMLLEDMENNYTDAQLIINKIKRNLEH